MLSTIRFATAVPVQFTLSGRALVVKYPRAKVSVFVVADQKGASAISGWISPLYARYEKRIEIAGIAALPSIPTAFHGVFRREFKKRVTYPVMLDWKGEVARSLGYEKQQAQLLVIARNGEIALTTIGSANAPALSEVFQAIDRLRDTR